MCPPGSYCPAGSAQPLQCAASTFQSTSGSALCDLCPAGYYCEYGAAEAISCPPGNFCPESTGYANQFPCPNGTYTNETGLADSFHCSLCPPGRCVLHHFAAGNEPCICIAKLLQIARNLLKYLCYIFIGDQESVALELRGAIANLVQT